MRAGLTTLQTIKPSNARTYIYRFIAKRPATGQERGVFTYSMGTPSVNHNVPSASISAVRETDVHFIRAVASKPCLLLACHTFLTPKVYPVTVNISNSLLKNYTLESTDIDIVEGINASIIANPEYNATGDSVVFTILPHTGKLIYIFSIRYSENIDMVILTENVFYLNKPQNQWSHAPNDWLSYFTI